MELFIFGFFESSLVCKIWHPTFLSYCGLSQITFTLNHTKTASKVLLHFSQELKSALFYSKEEFFDNFPVKINIQFKSLVVQICYTLKDAIFKEIDVK